MNNTNQEISGNAVRLYGQDGGMDDFPVLKAFQQYIDAEHAKARKRLLMMGVFFGFLMLVIISVFVVLLINVSSRNQTLNDRMLEYVMKDRERAGSAVVVQPQQDNTALLALTAKLDEMQKKLADSQTEAEKAKAEAVAAATPVKSKEQLAAEEEIKTLKALLAAEREKASLEKEKLRQAELEAYRRKHYPELYEQPSKPEPAPVPVAPVNSVRRSRVNVYDIDALLNDTDAINYFDAEDETEDDNQSIPIEVNGSNSSWDIPLE